jgi:hypothetical protein
MAHRSNWTLLAAACASLALSACGGSSSGGTANAASTANAATRPVPAATGAASSVQPTGNFCADVETVMRDVPSSPVGQRQSLAMAQAELGKVLRSSAAGYAAIEPEAPVSLRSLIHIIVGVYQADARRAATSGSIADIGQSIVKADSTGSGGMAFRRVLSYVSKHCG